MDSNSKKVIARLHFADAKDYTRKAQSLRQRAKWSSVAADNAQSYARTACLAAFRLWKEANEQK